MAWSGRFSPCAIAAIGSGKPRCRPPMLLRTPHDAGDQLGSGAGRDRTARERDDVSRVPRIRMRESSCLDAESRCKLPPPLVRQRERTTVEVRLQPLSRKRELQQGSTDRAADVRLSLAPIQAAECEPPSLRMQALDIHAEAPQFVRAKAGEAIALCAAR